MLNRMPTPPPLLGLAFRPFFLLGSLFSVAALALWLHFWIAPSHWHSYGNPLWWHGHEMVFGFAVAIIAGFLLTAVQNWTGVPSVKGWPLGLLVLLWLIPRITLPWVTAPLSYLVAFLDLLLLPLLALLMLLPVVHRRQWRNLGFAPVLLLFGGLNGLSHYGIINQQPALSMNAVHAGIFLITLLISIIGGRVIPLFTANATSFQQPSKLPWLEWPAHLGLLALGLLALWGLRSGSGDWSAVLCLLTAGVHWLRWRRWGLRYCWRNPLLWSLQLGYLFLPLGLVLLGMYGLGLIHNFSAGLHALLVGAIGLMILAMITRVSLGHTGRSLQPPRLMNYCFALMVLAALIRAGLPLLTPALIMEAINLAGIGWVLAYSAFVVCYWPILTSPRIDGKPG
ncbi:MAG: short-chain dehydrogenase [Pseudomonadales bacterium]|nr:short-chain dehydrogenase [Pseudomonadales bacterium]